MTTKLSNLSWQAFLGYLTVVAFAAAAAVDRPTEGNSFPSGPSFLLLLLTAPGSFIVMAWASPLGGICAGIVINSLSFLTLSRPIRNLWRRSRRTGLPRGRNFHADGSPTVRRRGPG